MKRGITRARTPKERKAAERARRYRAGYVLKQVWVRPEHWDRITMYIRRVTAEA
jgi:hypothetical protein